MQLGERKAFRWIAVALGLSVFGMALHGSGFQPRELFSAGTWQRAGEFLAEGWPPRTESSFVFDLLDAAIDTVAIAFLGIVAAVIVGFPLGVLGSRTVTAGALYATGDVDRRRIASIVYACARTVAAFCRSIPEVIWALIFVKAFGLGGMPAIAAFGLAYGGMLGKVYSEQLEAVDPAPAAAIEAVGGGKMSAFAWGVLPQAFGSMAEYTMYRFECAIRASVLMGFVGAQGLGIRLQYSASYYAWDEVLTETAVLVVIVAIVEAISDLLRRWIG